MSSKKIVECVPNFSEGKDKEIIDKICAAIETVDTVEILDVDMGADTTALLSHLLLRVNMLRMQPTRE